MLAPPPQKKPKKKKPTTTGFQKCQLKKKKKKRLKRQLSLQSNSLPETESAINIKSVQTNKKALI